MARPAFRAALSALTVIVTLLIGSPAGTAATIVPFQYVAKMYSEILGRGPDQPGWTDRTAWFAGHGCTRGTLTTQGLEVFSSAEAAGLAYSPAQRLLTAYRAVLNREPDRIGFDHYLTALTTGQQSITDVVAGMYAGDEFGALVPAICRTRSDYDFGTVPALALPVTGPGFQGDGEALQRVLDASAPSDVVTIAQAAVVPLRATLTVPAGVTLQTEGTPGPREYARMGRIVRDTAFTGEAVRVSPGATLRHLWLDGARTRHADHDRSRYTVRMMGGTGTTVTANRLGNPAGATNVESLGAGDGLSCAANVVSDNLIDAYTSQHADGLWADGISMHCEDVEVTGNTVLDATDVGIIIFALSPDVPQKSQVHDNVVIQAGQSAFGMLGADPFFVPGGGDPAGVASRSLAGSEVRDNTVWSSATTHSTFVLVAGTKAWFGGDAKLATGGRFTGNTTGDLTVRTHTAVVVSGVLGTTVSGNALRTQLVDVGATCPRGNVGASVTAGFAGGTIQGPFVDALYSGCLDPGD
jgi:hypothetical protein